MKRVLLLAVFILLSLSLIGCSGSKEDKIIFDKVSIQPDSKSNITSVVGEVVNNDNKTHTFVVRVTFYDDNQNIIGTAEGSVIDIPSGKTKTFEAMGEGNFTNELKYKIQVDSLQ